MNSGAKPGSRERVRRAVRHETPDRTPADFLATPEIWVKLLHHFGLEEEEDDDRLFDPAWERILQALQVDCRVLSYDMFCRPPEERRERGDGIDWWGSLGRSTPNRMFRIVRSDGSREDIWGNRYRVAEHGIGAYEELDRGALSGCGGLEDIRAFAWPDPDCWDFSRLPAVVKELDGSGERHIRFRVGSIFETAWQMRGMEAFLMDMAMDPGSAGYILERIAEIHEENVRRVMEILGSRLDMLYFYDDVASQESLLVSLPMWRDQIRPLHARLISLAHAGGIPVMYHCDGAVYPLLDELVEMGIDLLNPIQLDAIGVPPEILKAEFGDRLAFHGGLDIMELLPNGSPDQVRGEVKRLIATLSPGYVLCSSHHMQADTPVENILAAYEIGLR